MKTSEIAKLPLIILVGPTAVGKTELSIRIAKRINAEIISVDSRLFYRGMNIGTAKPSLGEMQGVPHYMIDIAEPDETLSLSVFQQQAAELIQMISDRGKLPMLVGGTGQYVRAVTAGWTPPAVEPNEALRAVLEQLATENSTEWLHQKLALIDPDAAAIIDHRNVRRTIRAIEVIFVTGEKFSTQRRNVESPYHCIFIGLSRPRAELYERVDQRIEAMFANGLLAEVEALVAKGYGSNTPSMSAIGYREALAVVNGEISTEAAIVEMKRNTRAYVRRQANWFKPDDPLIRWFEMTPDPFEHIIDHILQKIKE